MDSKCNLTFNEAKLKLESWCAYQDRCSSEVILKLKSFELSSDQEQKLIDYLTLNRFLDDQRYADSIVSGKFSNNSSNPNNAMYFDDASFG